MRNFFLRWLINGIALFVASELVAGITVEGGWLAFVVVALIFGLVNALIRPLLKLLTCPLVVLTLGFFTLVINALMLWLASELAGSVGIRFHVVDFMAAFWGGLVISIVSFVLSLLLIDNKR